MLTSRVDICIDQHLHPETRVHRGPQTNHVELLVIDEAERLSSIALEHLRDRFDRQHLGLLLIGMPGIEKRLAAYLQLYSRIGFAHQYRPLTNDELTFVLTHHWRRLGLTLDLDDFTTPKPSPPSDASPAATSASYTDFRPTPPLSCGFPDLQERRPYPGRGSGQSARR
jgi:AAA domain